MGTTSTLGQLAGKRVLITGGAGLLGKEHAAAVVEAGGQAVLVDLDEATLDAAANRLGNRVDMKRVVLRCADVTKRGDLEALRLDLESASPIDAIVNNAAVNPAMNDLGGTDACTFEDYPLEAWNREFAVGLTGALLVCQVFGAAMAERGTGAIVNIASDLGVIAPDHRIYARSRQMEDVRSFKPVSYSVCKTALIGLTRYVATYWGHRGVRCNALAPGGVRNGQDDTLIEGLIDRIPMRRMANADEYHGAIVFLCSEASAYMNGQTLVMDGGRSVW